MIDIYLIPVNKIKSQDIQVFKNYCDSETLKEIKKKRARQDRINTLISRATIKLIAHSRFHYPLDSLKLLKNPYGKLYYENIPIYFNIAHSKNFIILAMSDNSKVGIDVESVDSNLTINNNMVEVFQGQQQSYLKSFSRIKDKRIAFYKLWTTNEAFLKFIGVGLSQGIECYDIAPSFPTPHIKALGGSNYINDRCKIYTNEQVIDGDIVIISICTDNFDYGTTSYHVLDPSQLLDTLL